MIRYLVFDLDGTLIRSQGRVSGLVARFFEERFDAEKWGLTTREVELIAQVAKGLSNKEIAQTLFLSEGTVKNNISTILSKLELRDRTQLVIFAYDNKLKQ